MTTTKTFDAPANEYAVEVADVSELQEHLVRAEKPAREMLAKGNLIREERAKGNVNSSRASTVPGALSAAESLISNARHHDQVEPDDLESEWVVGRNLREAWRAIRSLWRR